MEIDREYELLKIIVEKNTQANQLVDSHLEQAIAACKACTNAVDEYIALGLPSSETVKALDAAGEKTLRSGTNSKGETITAETGIGCQACTDLQHYAQSRVAQKEIGYEK
jgi:hypothetical protein